MIHHNVPGAITNVESITDVVVSLNGKSWDVFIKKNMIKEYMYNNVVSITIFSATLRGNASLWKPQA